MGTTYTLTCDRLGDVVAGGVSNVHAAYVETNLPDGKALIDTTEDGSVMPSNVGRIPLAGDTFSIDLLGTANTGLNVAPNTLRYRIHVEHGKPGLKGLFDWYSDWFELTDDTALKTVEGELELVPPSTVADLLRAQISGYEEHGEVSGAVTFHGPTASHRFDATGPTTITLDDYEEGQVATLICFFGADDVTVVDAGDVTLVDGTAWAAELARGVWVSGGGGGTPAEPDTTPPSAVTDLEVEPDDDGTSAVATFTPATDTESTVKYRYRLYEDGDTAPAWPTSGPAFNLTGSPINLTDLTPGTDYVLEVQAYSAGGGAAADTATFSAPVPAGWNVVATDTFTAADGTVVDGRTSTTGGKVWALTSGPAVTIVANKVPWSATGYTGQELRLALGSDNTGGAFIEFDYTVGFKAGVAVDSPPHWCGVEFDGGNLYAAGGYPPTGLTGTTTGLATTGRARVEIVGTTLTFSIDGVVKATGTAPYTVKGNYVTVTLINGSSIDNVTVGTFA